MWRWLRGSFRRFSRVALPAVFLLLFASTPEAIGQEPPDTLDLPPDSLVVDSAAVADSLRADSVAVDGILAADSLPADSVAVDSILPPPVLPTLPDPVASAIAPGVWEWDRKRLLGVRGQTLWELLAEIPGLLALRSGDFGSSAVVFPVGYSGGGLRLYYDGVEHLPLDGSVPDLARVPLSGVERVRVVRRASGVEVHLFRFAHANPRPYSLIEAGNGDLSTNILRGTFSFPRAFQGKAALAIERLDTQGRETPGATTGGWFRYSLHRGDRAGLRLEVRRMHSERSDSGISPAAASRSDWTLQGSWTPADSLLAEAWATGASIQPGDTLEAFPFSAESRKQYGVRLTTRRGRLWGRTTARFNEGAGVVDRELSGEFSAVSSRWGGGSGYVWKEEWGGRAGSGYDLRAWLTPVSFVTVFAEQGDGARSVPTLRPLPPKGDTTGDPDRREAVDSIGDPDAAEAPAIRFTRRWSARYGVRLAWRRIEVAGAMVSVKADSVWPTQLPFDRGGVVHPQARRSGWEVSGRLPLRPRGLFLLGQVQLWEAQDSLALYFPDHLYQGALSFHRTFRSTGNFELWVDLGVQGRSPMTVPVPGLPEEEDGEPMSGSAPDEVEEEDAWGPSVVPFYQNWYFRLQMRFLSLNVFATVENLTLRPNNQDLPGRLLPGTRGLYGVRWTFWN